MKRFIAGAVAATTCLVLGAVAASPAAPATPQAWFAAFDAQDAAALKVLGDENVDYDHDKFEESGGLDFVRIDKDDGTNVEALARPRIGSGMWRVLFTRDAKDPSRFSEFRIHAEPLATAAATFAALDDFASRLQKKNAFAGVVLVRQDGRDLFAKAYGAADADGKVPNTLGTKFYFASSGKMFTAVSIFQLIDAGKVSLDDTVGKFLPDYANREIATKVTVRMLLRHTAGTGDIGILQPEEGANRARVHSIADIIALHGARGPEFEPGTKWDYANYDYILLGAIVEKASGMDYYAYVRKNIFDRVGMAHTGYPLREETAGIAVPMWMKDGKLVSAMDMWPWRGTPAGGGVATAGDEAKFLAALAGGKLISPAALALATHAPAGFGFKEGNGFGLGFIESGGNGLTYWGHGGGAHGDSVVVSYYPRQHMSFVCLANREPPACDRLAESFLWHWPRTP